MKKLWVILIVATMGGCKPVQTVQEKLVTTVDSTAVLMLEKELKQEKQENITLKTALEKSREEISRLETDMLIHTINYYTAGVINESGKYPIASETITTSNSVLKTTIKESEIKLLEYEKEVKAIMNAKRNLEYKVESLTEQIGELKSKTKPRFNLKSFIWGAAAGVLLALILFLKIK